MHTVEWIANRKNKAYSRHLTSGIILSVVQLRLAAFASESFRPKFTLKMKSTVEADENKQFGLEGQEAEGAKSSKKVA
jgi:hypothetical protein